MSKLSEEQLENGKVIDDFVSNRKNQMDAMVAARQLKDMLPSWFTARDVVDLHRPMLSEKPLKYGKSDMSMSDAIFKINTLYAFGLIKVKKGIGKKSPKYKVTMEAAAKAIEAHNKNMEAAKVIVDHNK